MCDLIGLDMERQIAHATSSDFRIGGVAKSNCRYFDLFGILLWFVLNKLMGYEH
jgi:hypothetical protein